MDPEWTLLHVLCRLTTRDRYIPATNSDVDPPPTTPPHLDPPSPFPRLTFPFLLFLTITLQYVHVLVPALISAIIIHRAFH